MSEHEEDWDLVRYIQNLFQCFCELVRLPLRVQRVEVVIEAYLNNKDVYYVL